MSVPIFRQSLLFFAAVGIGGLALIAWPRAVLKGSGRDEPAHTINRADHAPTTDRGAKTHAKRAESAPRSPSRVANPKPDGDAKGTAITGKVRPHPDSPERSALLTQRSLLERAKAAARSGDVGALRGILEGRHEEAADGAFDDWFEAYRVILGCLERKDLESQERARRFVDEERGSTMRRDVRRYCVL